MVDYSKQDMLDIPMMSNIVSIKLNSVLAAFL